MFAMHVPQGLEGARPSLYRQKGMALEKYHF
jgi:hypothetical protein